MDLGVKGCTAALYNMCVEPDGAVIPCQSYYQPLGNLMSDPGIEFGTTTWRFQYATPLCASEM
jgi:radical SAM protein with 4Fe4S-binding SPASM domain